MAITKVGTYRNPPEDITDYTAIAGHLNAFLKQVGSQAMILTEWANTTTMPKIALGSYISHGGMLYVVDTDDYAIAAPVTDGTYYLMVEASGDTLLLNWISDISGYSWNAIYNGLYDSDEHQVLPYTLVKTGTSLEKWKITNLMQGGGFVRVNSDGGIYQTGAITINGPAVLAGGLTVMKFLQYGTTYIDIPTIEELDPLAAGSVNIIAGLSRTSSETVTKNLSGNTKSPLVFRTSVTAIARVYEPLYQGSSSWAESTVVITLQKNGVTVATASAHVKRYGHNIPNDDYTETNTQTSGDVDVSCYVGDEIKFIVSIVTAKSSSGDMYGSGTGSYTGVNCDRALNPLAGETLTLV